jgi:DNA primase
MEWVSFDEIKRAVSLQMVIDYYRLKLKQVAPGTLRGKCPLPTHGSEKSSASFTATLTKGVGGAWACQSKSCIKASGRRGGNALDLVAAIERCSIREAALKLQQWFAVPIANNAPQASSIAKPPARTSPEPNEPQQPVSKETRGESEGPNKPLAFTLRGIDAAHPYIAMRGITRETANLYGIGYFSGKGTMAGRVVIPIHNGGGELVAYAGRTIDQTEPKYKFPAGFRKSQQLFNLHRAHSTGPGPLIIVEGFFDCMMVHQAGFSRVVALMGSSCSGAQAAILSERFGHVVLMLDGDEPGREAQRELTLTLAAQGFVCSVSVPDGKQPDQLSAQDIQNLLRPILG